MRKFSDTIASFNTSHQSFATCSTDCQYVSGYCSWWLSLPLTVHGTGPVYFNHVCEPVANISGQAHIRSAEWRLPVWVPGLRIDPLLFLAGCRKRRLNQTKLDINGSKYPASTRKFSHMIASFFAWNRTRLVQETCCANENDTRASFSLAFVRLS